MDGTPLALVNNGTVYYPHPDRLGTVQRITDAGQQVVWSARYEPFGQAVIASGIEYNPRFPGQYYDAETGLNYNHFRDYDAAGVGRYVESDPVGLRGGVNTYAYVGNNPLRWVDPLGLMPFAIPGTIPLPIGIPTNISPTDPVYGHPYYYPSRGRFGRDGFSRERPYYNEQNNSCPIKDLDPLHSPDTVGPRPDLERLSDDDLLDAVRNPENNDPLRVNTKTGKLVDDNSRALELIRRAGDPNSSITPNTKVPVTPYTPNDSMFWDQ